ncbi:hypothetical protein FBU30_005648 [Linnemannia zychae]|nr:hypothetical protein FBU30_005648 [Linnemannia zychae]
MRFSILFPSILAFLATTTSFISVNATPCEDCIIAAIYATSPTCDAQIFTDPLVGGPLTERQKSCFCPLASSDTWLQQCISPNLCAATDVNAQLEGFKSFKTEACASTATSSIASATVTASSSNPSSSSTATSPSITATPTSSSSGVRLYSTPRAVAGVATAVLIAYTGIIF